MIPLRISPATATAFDSLQGRLGQLRRTLGAGSTTTAALARADAELAAMVNEARSLRIHVRQDMANAKHREREDRSTRKVG